MSKGSQRRPTNAAAFASGWERIFKSGVGEQTKPAGPNPASEGDLAVVGANPTSAAKPLDDPLYVADDNGKTVSVDWWPGDPA